MKTLMICNTAKKGPGRLLSDFDLSVEMSILLPLLFVSLLFDGLRETCFGSTQGIAPGLSSAAEKIDNRQQDDSTQQCHQHGWNGNGIVDRPTFEDGAEKVASQECPQNGHKDVDQQVRAVAHDYSRYPADDCSYDQVNNDVYVRLL